MPLVCRSHLQAAHLTTPSSRRSSARSGITWRPSRGSAKRSIAAASAEVPAKGPSVTGPTAAANQMLCAHDSLHVHMLSNLPGCQLCLLGLSYTRYRPSFSRHAEPPVPLLAPVLTLSADAFVQAHHTAGALRIVSFYRAPLHCPSSDRHHLKQQNIVKGMIWVAPSIPGRTSVQHDHRHRAL